MTAHYVDETSTSTNYEMTTFCSWFDGPDPSDSPSSSHGSLCICMCCTLAYLFRACTIACLQILKYSSSRTLLPGTHPHPKHTQFVCGGCGGGQARERSWDSVCKCVWLCVRASVHMCACVCVCVCVRVYFCGRDLQHWITKCQSSFFPRDFK